MFSDSLQIWSTIKLDNINAPESNYAILSGTGIDILLYVYPTVFPTIYPTFYLAIDVI